MSVRTSLGWLFIDSSRMGVVRYGIIDSDRTKVRSVQGRSGILLHKISSFGVERLRAVKGVCVVAGPGSFSSVRGGVLMANILSRCLNVPLIGIDVSASQDISQLIQRLEQGQILSSVFVAPIYDAEPTITLVRS